MTYPFTARVNAVPKLNPNLNNLIRAWSWSSDAAGTLCDAAVDDAMAYLLLGMN